MATTLTTSLLTHYFSSQLPDLEWTTDSETLTVQLWCPIETRTLLEVDLTAVSGTVKLWEVREVAERWMRHNGLTFMPLVARWKEPGMMSYLFGPTMQVYYCTDILGATPATWIENNFLTTAPSKLLPAEGAMERLYFSDTASRNVTPKALVSYRLEDGTVRTMDVPGAEIQTAAGRISTVEFTVAELQRFVENQLETSVEVLAVTMRAGARVMAYYKPGTPANAAFAFRNMFNATEVAWLHCATTTKRKDGRKMASIARRTALYDLSLEVSHEVETEPLPLDIARWLAQLVTSPQAWLADGTPIVITDGEASISDDESVMNTIKFTWRRDDARAMSENQEDYNIFTQPPYSYQFD